MTLMPVHNHPMTDALVEDIPMPDVDEMVARTSALLADGIPLSLLLDLASPRGPHSAELWADEAPDLHWLLPAAAADEAEGHWPHD